jgi:hydrogenase maturation protein HypF
VIASFHGIYGIQPEMVVADMHPDYLSTKFARSYGRPLVEVQHHYAHIAACMAENELAAPLLGVSWDGTGYGLDSSVWGGEFLVVDDTSFRRVATFRGFRLPGGTSAIKEPRRTAIGVLYEIFGDALFAQSDLIPLRSFSPAELQVLRQVLARTVNSPPTSSAGRLFDAVAAISGVCQRNSFEGQAAMELEFAITEGAEGDVYPFALDLRQGESGAADLIIADWAPMILALLGDLKRGVPVGTVSARFHRTLAEIIVAVAQRVALERVALSGGCFQNKFLTERAVRRLEAAGFRPYWHQRIPPNDGGIAVGQIVAALRSLRKGE